MRSCFAARASQRLRRVGGRRCCLCLHELRVTNTPLERRTAHIVQHDLLQKTAQSSIGSRMLRAPFDSTLVRRATHSGIATATETSFCPSRRLLQELVTRSRSKSHPSSRVAARSRGSWPPIFIRAHASSSSVRAPARLTQALLDRGVLADGSLPRREQRCVRDASSGCDSRARRSCTRTRRR